MRAAARATKSACRHLCARQARKPACKRDRFQHVAIVHAGASTCQFQHFTTYHFERAMALPQHKRPFHGQPVMPRTLLPNKPALADQASRSNARRAHQHPHAHAAQTHTRGLPHILTHRWQRAATGALHRRPVCEGLRRCRGLARRCQSSARPPHHSMPPAMPNARPKPYVIPMASQPPMTTRTPPRARLAPPRPAPSMPKPSSATVAARTCVRAAELIPYVRPAPRYPSPPCSDGIHTLAGRTACEHNTHGRRSGSTRVRAWLLGAAAPAGGAQYSDVVSFLQMGSDGLLVLISSSVPTAGGHTARMHILRSDGTQPQCRVSRPRCNKQLGQRA